LRVRIGDPDHTISGRETYRIAYRIGHALNGFSDHDELYWNATGHWPVTIRQATAVVHAPRGAINESTVSRACGDRQAGGSHLRRRSDVQRHASVVEGEELTIVTACARARSPNHTHLVPTPRD
jgi:hypothetical protein